MTNFIACHEMDIMKTTKRAMRRIIMVKAIAVDMDGTFLDSKRHTINLDLKRILLNLEIEILHLLLRVVINMRS